MAKLYYNQSVKRGKKMVSIFLTIGIVVGSALTVSGAAMIVKKCNKNLGKNQSADCILQDLPYSIQKPIENYYDLFLKEEFSKTTNKRRTDGFIANNHFGDFGM